MDEDADWRDDEGLGEEVTAYVDKSDKASLKTVAFSAGKGGNITGEVSQTVDQGFSSTPVTAIPNSGYRFTGWAGDHTGTENPLTVTVSDDIRIIANFERIEHTVSFEAGNHGRITDEIIQKRFYGENCAEVTAVPDEGYVFVRWEGDHAGSENPLAVTDVKSDMHITAIFEISRHAVTFSAETGGKITGETVQEVEHGSDCSPVTAEADVGYEFTGWIGCEDDTNPLTVSGVTADMKIMAQFTRKTYTVTFRSGENGSISGDAAQVVEHGNGTTSVTANPAEGYHFVRWSGDHTSTENPLTLGNVTKNMTITAEFGVNEYTVVFTAGDNGTLAGETSQTVENGDDTISVTGEPADGYRFVGWTGDHTGTENPLILENVTEDYTVQAVFAEPDKYSISVTTKGCCGSVEPSGTVSVTEGETPAFVITSDEHFKVVEILADGDVVADIGETYQFEDVVRITPSASPSPMWRM